MLIAQAVVIVQVVIWLFPWGFFLISRDVLILGNQITFFIEVFPIVVGL